MGVKSNNDRPFDIAESSFCWSTQSDTPFARQFSKILISSTSDLPIRSMDQTRYPVDSARLDRIDHRDLSWPVIMTLPHRLRAVCEYVPDSPSTLGCGASQARKLLF